ncbi:hypothetical protein FRACYDRAFT_237594 [Fragilariopsis cylindrus CCMP1102]|uniref:CRAL-TRIO domain-containing protein n=1 Tax=Fragilariopsis cylindrus CCMP1102 TaxID=635003 RepID=A0A1E7FG73_9STRA|nr:hypothetical protein FRACYDRAFT_237594 [Fragilariopsis cylindrus CCMP1102]|eukprot:OEU17180.1 hypothetical protein FRACYDRAFT_237594 [Fragilariopsis cylindrus CCMP1102]
MTNLKDEAVHLRRRCVLESSSSSSSSSSSVATTGRVRVVPTISKTVSSIKPFLLGFVVAVILIGFATLTSIYTFCNGYNTAPLLPSPMNNDGNAVSTSVCKLKEEKEERKEYGTSSRLQRRWWRKLFSKKKKKVHPVVCDETVLPQLQLDQQSCVCHLIWESFGYDTDFGVIDTGGANTFLESEIQQQQPHTSLQFPSAFTEESIQLTEQQKDQVRQMAKDTLESIPEFERRISAVPWGGKQQKHQEENFATVSSYYEWYAHKMTKKERGTSSISAPLDQIDGGNLFSSYLRIMKWPKDLDDVNFPFKLCRAKKKIEGGGCDASAAILHTLEFRERYKPWLVTPSIKKANSEGLIYQRGFSPPYSGDENGSHAIVVIRLSRRVPADDKDGIYFTRAMIREFDRAVAASLQRSNGRVGKFNAVVDGKDLTWSKMPSIGTVKGIIAILQDHFADRLGVVVVVNVGGPICEILLKIFVSLITEEVRNKIVMLPHDQNEQMAVLETILGKENIPIWLGGVDNYIFQVDEHYANNKVSIDDEALDYLATMP